MFLNTIVDMFCHWIFVFFICLWTHNQTFILNIFDRRWKNLHILFFCLFVFWSSDSSFLHLWITDWCKWPYWSLDCKAGLVKLLLIWDSLPITGYTLYITGWMYFLSTLMSFSVGKLHARKDWSSSVWPSVHTAAKKKKKVKGLIPTAAAPSDCECMN